MILMKQLKYEFRVTQLDVIVIINMLQARLYNMYFVEVRSNFDVKASRFDVEQ